MNRRQVLKAAAASCALFCVNGQSFSNAQTGWTQLFDGKTLDNWRKLGDANWRVEDGVIAADKGKSSYLVTPDSYRNFELYAEIWVDEKANSGIFFRCSDPNKVTSTTAYEANVFDTSPNEGFGTGSIVRFAKVANMPRAAGKWSSMEISAMGDTMNFKFAGIHTIKDFKDTTYADGPIALQYGTGVVKFRNVRIRRI